MKLWLQLIFLIKLYKYLINNKNKKLENIRDDQINCHLLRVNIANRYILKSKISCISSYATIHYGIIIIYYILISYILLIYIMITLFVSKFI